MNQGNAPAPEYHVRFFQPDIGLAEMDAVRKVLESGWLGTGPVCERFEEAFAREVGAAGALAVSSCTVGIHVLLMTRGIGPGDEVITSPITHPATVNAILMTGATAVLVDVEPETLCLDPDAVKRALTSRTRCVVPVHYAGIPADLPALRDLCAHHDLYLVSDAAHAVGSRIANQGIGQGGDSCFSLAATKLITAGEGGVVTSDDCSLLHELRTWSRHGVQDSAWNRYRKRVAGAALATMPGFRMALSDIQAALALAQTSRLDDLLKFRQQLSAGYDDLIQRSGCASPLRVEDVARQSNHYLYPVLLETHREVTRHSVATAMAAEGIEVGLHFELVHRHQAFQKHDRMRVGDLSVAEKLTRHLLTLPMHHALRAQDQEAVINTLEMVLGQLGHGHHVQRRTGKEPLQSSV